MDPDLNISHYMMQINFSKNYRAEIQTVFRDLGDPIPSPVQAGCPEGKGRSGGKTSPDGGKSSEA